MKNMSQGPKYLQIRDYLIQQFHAGAFVEGQRLPTEHELVEQLRVSRTTIRQALSLLEEEGMVERKHGSGSYFRGLENREDNRKKPKGLIGLINFFLNDYIYPDIISGIEDTLSAEEYSLVLACSNRDEVKQLEALYRLVDQGISGLILEPSHNVQLRKQNKVLEIIENLNIPVVTTHWGISSPKISTVTIDDVQAGYFAARYLIDHGHSEIAMIFKDDVQAGHDRYQGLEKAMQEAGLQINPDFIKRFNNNDEIRFLRQGYLLTQQLLSNPEQRPSAIFYFNDFTALHGYTAIREAGLLVPRDISIMGFDNYRGSELIDPPLTTFEHPKYALGQWAAKVLIDELDGKKTLLPMKIIFEPVLIERQSVGSPPRPGTRERGTPTLQR